MSLNAKLKQNSTQFDIEEIEIKIEYDKYLTPHQVAVFYSGLDEILSQYKLSDVKLVLSHGSLKTKVISKMFVGLASMIKNSYSKPKTELEKKHISKLTNSLNNNNFSVFSINSNILYNSNNIAQKAKEMKQLHEELTNKQETKEDVETLQMKITFAKELKAKENKLGKVKETEKFQFIAKFDDSRYIDFKEELRILTKEESFAEIDLNNAHEYYFIADGILYKSKGKYVKFEIKNLIKPPTLTKKLEQAELF